MATTLGTELTASVVIPFEDEVLEDKYVLEAAQRQVKPPTGPYIGPPSSYFLVLPSATGLGLTTTGGSLKQMLPAQLKQVYEQLTFSGEDTYQELKYPHPHEVSTQLIGRVIRPTGSLISAATITFTYDQKRNAIKASERCYAVIQVKYKAPYDLWLAIFPLTVALGHAKPPRSPDPEDQVEPDSHPIVIVATKEGKAVAELTLTPPDWTTDNKDGAGGGGFRVLGGQQVMNKLALFVDPKDPIRLLTVSGVKPVAGCGVICVPGISGTTEVTSGKIDSEEAIASTEQILEALTFSGQPSISLRYTPASKVDVTVVGGFYDSDRHPFTPTIAKPGDWINMVEWISTSEFRNPQPRLVIENELVLCDSFNNAISGYGAIKVRYAITKRKYKFQFAYDAESKTFLTAWMVIQNGNAVGTLELNGPVLRSLGRIGL